MNEKTPATSADVLECLDRLVEKGEMVVYQPIAQHFSQVWELIRIGYASQCDWTGPTAIIIPTEQGKELAKWRKMKKFSATKSGKNSFKKP